MAMLWARATLQYLEGVSVKLSFLSCLLRRWENGTADARRCRACIGEGSEYVQHQAVSAPTRIGTETRSAAFTTFAISAADRP